MSTNRNPASSKPENQLSAAVDLAEREIGRIRDEFPGRWRNFVRRNYRNPQHISRVFGVSERAARKWWSGEMGCKGAYVIAALVVHPEEAMRMLIEPYSGGADEP